MDKALAVHLEGKSADTLSLFHHFIGVYQKMDKITVEPTKSMIAIAGTRRVAYIIRLGKNFMDVVFPFTKPYPDNLCFTKIAPVPGQQQYNHHFRMMHKDDVNEEVKKFMLLALREQ